MKNRLFLLTILVAMGLALAACATPPERQTADDGVVRIQSNLDHERIQAINQAANRTGARVIWVNPPQKREREQNR